MSALLELAERCEQAMGPSFDLFSEAFAAIHGGRSTLGQKWSNFCALIEADAWLDAAMHLVPEEWTAEIYATWAGNEAPSYCQLWKSFTRTSGNCRAATPALALCAASLRARAAIAALRHLQGDENG